jgi:hypothetical protein
MIWLIAEVAYKACERGENWEATRLHIATLLHPDSNDRRIWFAYVSEPQKRRSQSITGPHETREAAIKAVFDRDLTARQVTSGRGLDGPYGDVQWTRRRDWEEKSQGDGK